MRLTIAVYSTILLIVASLGAPQAAVASGDTALNPRITCEKGTQLKESIHDSNREPIPDLVSPFRVRWCEKEDETRHGLRIRWDSGRVSFIDRWEDGNRIAVLYGPNQQAEDCSLIDLIANPEKYDGKMIRVVGYFMFELENQAVYVSQDLVTKNAIWVENLTEELQEHGGPLPIQEFVWIEGVFDMKNKGDRNGFSGALKDVYRVTRRRSRWK